MKETVYKHLDKKYPDYASLVNMSDNPNQWVSLMFGLDYNESRVLYGDWCKDRYDCIVSAIISSNGDNNWFKDGCFHRDNDLPAIEYANGRKVWYQNDKKHRDNGPAIVHANGREEWYKNGREYTPRINKL